MVLLYLTLRGVQKIRRTRALPVLTWVQILVPCFKHFPAPYKDKSWFFFNRMSSALCFKLFDVLELLIILFKCFYKLCHFTISNLKFLLWFVLPNVTVYKALILNGFFLFFFLFLFLLGFFFLVFWSFWLWLFDCLSQNFWLNFLLFIPIENLILLFLLHFFLLLFFKPFLLLFFILFFLLLYQITFANPFLAIVNRSLILEFGDMLVKKVHYIL